MGFRFRKSVKVGLFRINFSKKGVGWSVGVPGYRKTFKVSGGSRTTYSIPGTGLSYSYDNGGKKKKNSISSKTYNSSKQNINNLNCNPSKNIETSMNDSNQNEFVTQLNKITSYNKNRIIALIVSSCLGIGCIGNFGGDDTLFYVLMLLGCIGVIIYFFRKKTIDLEIEMDDDYEEPFLNLCNSVSILNSINKVWEINSYNINANNVSVARSVAAYGKGKIDNLISENQFMYINSKRSKIYFLPNMILVYQNKKWYGVEYGNVELGYTNTTFNETETIPNDTKLAYKKYLHQNKDGSPDKRYNVNPLICYYEYGIVAFESTNGLKLYILISNREKGQEFEKCVRDYINIVVSQENDN